MRNTDSLFNLSSLIRRPIFPPRHLCYWPIATLVVGHVTHSDGSTAVTQKTKVRPRQGGGDPFIERGAAKLPFNKQSTENANQFKCATSPLLRSYFLTVFNAGT